MIKIIQSDCRDVLKTLPDNSVHCCVTSPPYFGLRDYGVAGQMGLEETPEAFIAGMVEVFREVRRVLREDGTLWMNMGDSYANDGKWGGHTGGKHVKALHSSPIGRNKRYTGLKPKDLVGMPWALALALRDDGWWLRQACPWLKRNPLPESAKDRPTTAVEYVFMLTKSQSYFYDYDAIKRRASPGTNARLAQDVENQAGSSRANGGMKTNGPMKAVRAKLAAPGSVTSGAVLEQRAYRNTDVFFDSLETPFGAITLATGEIIAFDTVTEGFKEAHFATFPPKLIVPMVVASCPQDGTLLDPFFGAGTTGLVADRLQRNCIGIELNTEYAAIARKRINGDAPLFAEVI